MDRLVIGERDYAWFYAAHGNERFISIPVSPVSMTSKRFIQRWTDTSKNQLNMKRLLLRPFPLGRKLAALFALTIK
jgi:hypothetical protein